jgi:hypothetical protein
VKYARPDIDLFALVNKFEPAFTKKEVCGGDFYKNSRGLLPKSIKSGRIFAFSFTDYTSRIPPILTEEQATPFNSPFQKKFALHEKNS